MEKRMNTGINLKEKDWAAGYDAGRRREPNRPPQGADGLSWHSGYIEGKAQPWDPAGSQGDVDPDHIDIDGPRS
jgi:hypothetical protein